MLTLIFRTNNRKDKEQVLQEVRENIEVIRLFIRLMKDMYEISLKRFVQVNLKAGTYTSGLPGSNRNNNGTFNNIGNNGIWWSSTENSSNNAWNRKLNYLP